MHFNSNLSFTKHKKFKNKLIHHIDIYTKCILYQFYVMKLSIHEINYSIENSCLLKEFLIFFSFLQKTPFIPI